MTEKGSFRHHLIGLAIAASWAFALRVLSPSAVAVGAAVAVAGVGSIAFALGIAMLDRGWRTLMTMASLFFGVIGLWLTHVCRCYELAAPAVTVPAMLAVAWILYHGPRMSTLLLGTIALVGAIVAAVHTTVAYRLLGAAVCIAIAVHLAPRRRA